MFEAVHKQSLSDVVFDQLRSRIVNRELKAGDELPSERLLCELLQVNRGAVREAIKRLQQAGLVQVRHGGATTVLDYRAESGPELLPSLLVDEEGRIQVEVARSIVRMRQVLSPAIAADAARHASADTVKSLEEVLASMQASSDTGQLQLLAFAFWEVLVDGSGNIAYRLALNSLRKTYRPIWELLTQMLEQEFQDLDSFQQLYEAVHL
ncbi:MAG: GntR family transcriptional regulator, partial [Oceanisphaera sp.]|nr:GntR family transcriptional regulator [Oceanisphaera sp.]